MTMHLAPAYRSSRDDNGTMSSQWVARRRTPWYRWVWIPILVITVGLIIVILVRTPKDKQFDFLNIIPVYVGMFLSILGFLLDRAKKGPESGSPEDLDEQAKTLA